jgi:hypothetical protein
MLALLLPLLQQLVSAFPWSDWEQKGLKATWEGFTNWVRDEWTTNRAAIAAKLTEEGWSYHSVTPQRPDPPGAFVADIEYRLWHHVFLGGWPRDFMRDSHFPHIFPVVKDKITPDTTPEEAVKIVQQAEDDLTF